MRRVFTVPDAWSGGTFELALELGPPDDARLRRAFEAMWSHPDVEGVYLDREREPETQPQLRAREVDPLEQPSRGVVRFDDQGAVPCTVGVVREEGGADWLNFSFPISALSRACPEAGNAFFDLEAARGTRDVEIRRVEDWLAGMGQRVFAQVPFRLGLIGWMVSGMETAEKLEAQGVPAVRVVGYLWPESAGMRYYPRTPPE